MRDYRSIRAQKDNDLNSVQLFGTFATRLFDL
jgi:hypothetical protein